MAMEISTETKESKAVLEAIGRDVKEAFKRAMALEVSLEEKASKAILEGIGKDVKGEKLGPEENAFLENAIRSLLDELVRLAVQDSVPVMQYGKGIGGGDSSKGFVPRLLDIILLLCRDAHVEAGLIFTLLLDLTEASTIEDCHEVFSYIESQQEVLGKPELHTRGKLVMLRTCNQLLRRLSKANDNVFCGRIIMFLAHFFPLSERSAVNVKGFFNTSNETKYETEPEGVDGMQLDGSFYKMFWGLQNYFRNPPSALAVAAFQSLSTDLQAVLSVFESQRLADNDELGEVLVDGDDMSYNTKYLTSTKLMSLQIRDPNFQRHFLVQCLILFDYLNSPAKIEKDYLREDQKAELVLLEEKVKKLLESTPPKGKEFLKSIEHVLWRERNWVWWKRDNCMPLERLVTERLPLVTSQRRRTKRNLLGNPELSRLWTWAQANPDVLVDPERVKVPSISEYWKPMADDMDPNSGIEEEYHHKKNRVYCWRGLRLNARQELDLFAKMTEHGIEGAVPAQLLPEKKRREMFGKLASTPPAKAARAEKKEGEPEPQPASQDGHATNGEEAAVLVVDGGAVAGDEGTAAAAMETDGAIAGPIEEGDGEAEDGDDPLSANNAAGGSSPKEESADATKMETDEVPPSETATTPAKSDG